MARLTKENPNYAKVPINEAVIDPETHMARTQVPSESAPPPTRSETEPQQASTQPGGGSEIRANQVEAPGGTTKVPFKEQVIGVAKKTRGTLLGKPELKQQGERILEGKESAHIHEEPASL